jgi:hypothetical protein
MAVHRDAPSGRVARTVRAGRGTFPRPFGGGWTRIGGQAFADVSKWVSSAASRARRTSGWAAHPEARRRSVLPGRPLPTAARSSWAPNHRPTVSGQPRALPLPRNERAGRPFGRTRAPPGPRKTHGVCGRGRRHGKEASQTGKCSPPDAWILAEMTSAAGLVAGGRRRWRGGGAKARAKTAQEPMMCRLTCANVAESARIYGILSRELPPLCAPRTRLFRHRRAVAL